MFADACALVVSVECLAIVPAPPKRDRTKSPRSAALRVARSLSPPVLLGFFRLFADVPAALDRGIARPHRALHGPSFQLGLRLLHLALPIALGFASDANA